ncbi:MAG: 30S ribosomal protein S2, partial [Chthoniobacterales bacterium]
GGTLTNLATIRKSVARMKYIEDLQKAPNFSRMNKREASVLKREAAKIMKNLEGVRNMDKLPDAVMIIDTKREEIAVAEARRLKIPIVALVDTNSNPEIIDHPVAGNDDAIRSIRIILQKLVDAIMEANSTRQKKLSTDLAAVGE